MSEEELIETLRAFEKNRVEQLEEPAKNLFYAIMEIADERDRLNNIINELECWLRKNLSIEEKNDLQICLNKLEQLKNKKIYGSSKYEVVYFGEALGSDKE